MPDIPLALSRALVDRYHLEHDLGAGGMARVYLATDVKHHRQVALKVLRPALAAVIGAERFLKEIETTANLQHPHILPLFEPGQVNGTVFYVMPFVEGESLRDLLHREKQLPVDDAVRITREVASALDYAHRHGVIHRDIKPENILLHDGQALVADFGIALAASTPGGARLTETGLSPGTPPYTSPEQARGERQLDARTDVYALGCVLYEMLLGEPPFTGPTAQAIVAKVVTEKPPLVTALRDSVPARVAGATQRTLAKLPADRFHSAAELADALAGRRVSQSFPDDAGTNRVFLRDLASTEAVPVAGTDGATDPSFSPDGEWIVFAAGGKVRKVGVQGGPAIDLAGSNTGIAASSGPDGTIVHDPVVPGGLARISAAGGSPEPLTALDTIRRAFAALVSRRPAQRQGRHLHQLPDAHRPVPHRGARVRIPQANRVDRGSHLRTVLGQRTPAVRAGWRRVRGPLRPVQLEGSGDGRAGPRRGRVVGDQWAGRRRAGAERHHGLPQGLGMGSGLARGLGRPRRSRAARDAGLGVVLRARLSPDGKWIALSAYLPKRDPWLYDRGRGGFS
jgi:hypothetical protein